MRPRTRIARVKSLFAASAPLIVGIASVHSLGWPVAAFAAAAPQQTTRLSFEAEFPAASVGQPYMQSLKASGGAGGYTFAEGGTLPPGMQWVPVGDGLLLRGTPTQVGEYALRLVVNDSSGQQLTRDVDFKVTPHTAAATVPVSVNETLTTTDAVNVLLPVVVNVNETLTTTDAVNPVAVATTSASLTPATQDFGSDPVGSISPMGQQTFTLTNTGQTLLTSTVVTLTGTNASSFSVLQNGCSASLAVASQCSIYVLFEPTATGSLSATLNVTSTSSTGTVTNTSSLTGTGIPGPTLTVTPNPVSFPSTAINTTATPITVMLSNTGNGQLGLNGTQVGTVGGADAAYFSFFSGSCGYSGIAVGQSCSGSVSFTPDAARTFNATLTIRSNDPNSPAVIPLIGIGGTGTPQATLLPAMASFGTVAVGATSAAQNFTLTNTGTAPLILSNEAIGLPTQFVITSNGCQSPLAAGASCSLAVVFAPTTATLSSGTLTVTDNAGGAAGATQSVNFTGTGFLPVTLTPAYADIPNVALGSSASTTATLTNPNSFAITGISASLTTLVANTGFSLSGGSCGSTLAANSTCTYIITFAPTSSTLAGSQGATLNVSAANAATLHAQFTGESVGLTASLTPAPFDFGMVAVNNPPVTHAFTLTNTSPVTVSLIVSLASSAGPSGASAFSYDASACGTTLAVNASCTIAISFTPPATGPQNGTLRATVQSGTLSTTVTADFTGTGATTLPVTLSPLSYNFQTVTTGTSLSTTFTLTNNSSGALAGLQSSIFGDPSLQISGGSCGTALAAGASCSYIVTFMPMIAGPVTARLNVSSTGYSLSSLINGTGLLPRLSLTPASYNFANVVVGTTASTTAILTNSNAFDVTGLSASFTGPFFEGLALGSTTCGSTLAAGATCAYNITFTPLPPSTSGGISVAPDATLQVTGANGTSNPAVFTGQGVLPALTLTGHDFGSVVDGTSATYTATLSNPNAVSIGGISVSLTGPFSGDFSVSGTTCGTTLAANSSCTYTITFAATPSPFGAPSATLTVSGTNVTAASAVFTGTGVLPTLTLSPANYDFGNVTLGNAVSTAFTLSNPGSVAASISGLTFTGAGAAAYSQTNNCPATLAANSSCAINVTLNTSAIGSYAATLAVADNASGGPQTATLTAAVAGVAQAVLSPAILDFGAVNVGSTASQTVTLSNPGTTTLNGIGGTIGVSAPQFGFFVNTATPCSTSLAAGASCTITLSFTPTGIAPVAGTFSLLDGLGVQTVSLSGSGLQAIPTFTPSSLNFPDTTLQTTSAPLTVQFANTGNTSLPITSISITGANASSFTLGANTCGASLAGGATCTVAIQFSPATTGAFTANLAFVDAIGTQSVALQGNSIVPVGSPDFTLTPLASGYQNIPPGTTLFIIDGSFSAAFQIASASNSLPFTGTVVFAATGPEAGTTLSFSPASVVPGPSATMVNLNGQLPKVSSLQKPQRFELGRGGPGAVAFAGLLLLCFSRRRIGRLQSLRLVLALICLLPVALTFTGCATGYLLPGYSIPGGKGVITVTGTSGSVVHTLQITIETSPY